MWKMKDLEKTLTDLKNEKSRYNEGYLNELFKEGVIGHNLKKSMLMLYNRLREEKLIPIFMDFPAYYNCSQERV